MAGGELGLVDLIVKDHNEVKELMKQCQGTQDHNEKKKVSGTIFEMICRHTFAEEQLLYPILRTVLNHPADSDKSLNEHNQLKQLLKECYNVQPQEDKFGSLFMKIKQMTEDHIIFEEQNVLPLMSQAFNADQQQQLARSFKQLEENGPARPDETGKVPKDIQSLLNSFLLPGQQQQQLQQQPEITSL